MSTSRPALVSGDSQTPLGAAVAGGHKEVALKLAAEHKHDNVDFYVVVRIGAESVNASSSTGRQRQRRKTGSFWKAYPCDSVLRLRPRLPFAAWRGRRQRWRGAHARQGRGSLEGTNARRPPEHLCFLREWARRPLGGTIPGGGSGGLVL